MHKAERTRLGKFLVTKTLLGNEPRCKPFILAKRTFPCQLKQQRIFGVFEAISQRQTLRSLLGRLSADFKFRSEQLNASQAKLGFISHEKHLKRFLSFESPQWPHSSNRALQRETRPPACTESMVRAHPESRRDALQAQFFFLRSRSLFWLWAGKPLALSVVCFRKKAEIWQHANNTPSNFLREFVVEISAQKAEPQNGFEP